MIPIWVQFRDGDNTPVALPVWMAKDLLAMCRKYRTSSSAARTPCFAFEEEECIKDFDNLIWLAETGIDPTGHDLTGHHYNEETSGEAR